MRALRAALALVLFALVVGAFSSVLGGEFSSLDDHQNLLYNPHFRGFGAGELTWMASTPHMGNYQPLSWIVYALDFELWGLSAPRFHLSSVLLHAVVALAFFFLACEFLRLAFQEKVPPLACEIGAAFAAAAFAVHPLRAESVAWITGRNDVVAGLFLAFALIAWLRYASAARVPTVARRDALAVTGLSLLAAGLFFASVDLSRRNALGLHGLGLIGLGLALAALIAAAQRWIAAARPTRGRSAYWLALVGAFLSLGSKGYCVVLPALLLSVDVWPLRRFAFPSELLRARGAVLLLEKAPFIALSVVFSALTAWAKAAPPGLLRTLAEHGLLERVLQSAYGLAFYLRKTLIPTALVPMVDLPSTISLRDLRFLQPLIGVVALTAFLVLRRRRFPALLAAWVAYAILIGPSLGLAQSGAQLVADRYSYIASWPFALLAGGGVALLAANARDTRHRGRRALLFAALPLVVGGLFVATWQQARLWRDSQTLFRHAIATNGSPRMITNLAMLENWRSYEEPERRAEHLALALALSDQAIAVATERGVLVPTYGLHHATILYNLGRDEEAVVELEAYVAARPDDPEGALTLGLALNRLERLEEAELSLTRATRLAPWSGPAWRNLGFARESQAKRAAAADAYRRALSIDPLDGVSRKRLLELESLLSR